MSTPGRSGYAGGSAGCAPMMTHYDFEKRQKIISQEIEKMKQALDDLN